jgi:hypothetical protein
MSDGSMQNGHAIRSPSAERYEPISYTARKILQKRALHTSIPLAREMAEAAGVPWQVSPLRAWLRRRIWGDVRSGRYLQFRHDAISAAMAGFPGSPVLEIGAGFGTRGLAEASSREAYVETDLPELIAWKRSLVGRMASTAPSGAHRFLEMNACDRDDVDRASELLAGLTLNRPLVVVHEGVLVYFDDDERRAFRDNVRLLLERHPHGGAWITPDLSERDMDEGAAQAWLARRLRRQVGRPLNRFASDAEVERFLAEGSLDGTKLPSPHRDDPDPEARGVAESFRAWVIRIDGRS